MLGSNGIEMLCSQEVFLDVQGSPVEEPCLFIIPLFLIKNG